MYLTPVALLQYVDEDGERETIWNSREGAVPAEIVSRAGSKAVRVRQADRPAVDHVPAVGDRIIVNLTETRARVLAAARVDWCLEHEEKIVSLGIRRVDERFETREAAIQSAFENIYQPGMPDLLVVTRGYIDELLQQRAVHSISVFYAGTGDVVVTVDGERIDPDDGERLDPDERLNELTRGMYFDRDGLPVGFLEYVRLQEQPDYLRVAYTQLSDDVYVSTVWLGADIARLGGPPLIFETMVFQNDAGNARTRYSTIAEAIIGHISIVEQVKRLLEDLRPGSD